MRARTTVATGTALVLSVAGCRQVLDTTGYGTKGPAPTYPGASDGVLYASESCRNCVDGQCFTEAGACAADPACAAKAQCFAGCAHDDHECRGRCNLSIPDTPAMRALVQCEAVQACSECGSSRAVWSGEECDACLAGKCSPELDAFSRDAAALERQACEEECPDPSVPPYCGCRGETAANADGGAGVTMDAGQELVLTELQKCMDVGPCSAACGKGTPDWGCLGSVQWPAPAATLTDVALHVRLVNVVDDTPLSGKSVDPCSELGVCGTSVRSTTTLDDGWALLELPRLATGDGFFGHLAAPDADLDALLYLFPPVRESPSWRKVRVLTQDVARHTSLTSADGTPIPLDWDSTGGIAWSVAACNKAPAPGVKVTLDSGDPAFYSATNTLVPKTGAGSTSAAVGVFVNLTKGPHKLTATRVQTGQIIGTYPVQVLIGSITHVTMVPTPTGE